MIHSIIRNFEAHDKKIDALTYLLTFLTACLYLYLLWTLYTHNFEVAATLFGLLTASVAGLLLSLTASRNILHQQITSENERRAEVVMVTHNLIAVTKDLQGRIHYFGEFLKKGDRPVIVLETLAESIDARYESLLEQTAYKHLPGNLVDCIVSLSGSIFGTCRSIEALRFQLRNHNKKVSDLFEQSVLEDQVKKISGLVQEVRDITDLLFELRGTIDTDKEKSITNN